MKSSYALIRPQASGLWTILLTTLCLMGFLLGCAPVGMTPVGIVPSLTRSVNQPALTATTGALSDTVTETRYPTRTAYTPATPDSTKAPPTEESVIVAKAIGWIGQDVFWSSDGRSVLYPDWTDASGKTWKQLDLATTQVEMIAAPAAVAKEVWDSVGGLPDIESVSPIIMHSALSPSGRWLPVMRTQGDGLEGQLMMLDTESGATIPMDSPGACAYQTGAISSSWSADEKVAALICGGPYGDPVVSFADLETGHVSQEPLVIGEALQFNTLSPDGRYYAYMENSSSLRVTDWRTGSEVEVSSNRALTLYGWRGDHELIFIQNDSHQIYGCEPVGILSFQPDTGEYRALADFPLKTDGGVKVSASCRRPFIVAPDGSAVLFASDDGIFLIADLP